MEHLFAATRADLHTSASKSTTKSVSFSTGAAPTTTPLPLGEETKTIPEVPCYDLEDSDEEEEGEDVKSNTETEKRKHEQEVIEKRKQAYKEQAERIERKKEDAKKYWEDEEYKKRVQ